MEEKNMKKKEKLTKENKSRKKANVIEKLKPIYTVVKVSKEDMDVLEGTCHCSA